MLRRHLTTAVVYIACFLNIAPCLIITGCSENFDKKSTSSQNVEESIRAEREAIVKAELAARERAATILQKMVRGRNVKQEEARAETEKVEAVTVPQAFARGQLTRAALAKQKKATDSAETERVEAVTILQAFVRKKLAIEAFTKQKKMRLKLRLKKQSKKGQQQEKRPKA
jgi:hypothetical protein